MLTHATMEILVKYSQVNTMMLNTSMNASDDALTTGSHVGHGCDCIDGNDSNTMEAVLAKMQAMMKLDTCFASWQHSGLSNRT
jgi:hypothetical protein